jgi:hypothetical protein
MTAAILEFRQQDKRCCKCRHWTPIDAASPFGICENDGEKADHNWTCENWKSPSITANYVAETTGLV